MKYRVAAKKFFYNKHLIAVLLILAIGSGVVFFVLPSGLLAKPGKGHITVNNRNSYPIMVAFKGAGCAHVFSYSAGSTPTGCKQVTIPAGGKITYDFGLAVTNRHVRVIVPTTPAVLQSGSEELVKYWNDNLLNMTIPVFVPSDAEGGGLNNQGLVIEQSGNAIKNGFVSPNTALITTSGNCSDGGGHSVKFDNGAFDKTMDITTRFTGVSTKQLSGNKKLYKYEFNCEYTVH